GGVRHQRTVTVLPTSTPPRPRSARMIEVSGLTKRYGPKLAVDGLSFDVADGKVTGFVCPNGAGKSTPMRMILGLDRPTDGSSTINGKHLSDMPLAMREVGALLD